MKKKLINGDCIKILPSLSNYDCIFADIPDNIGLKYKTYNDKKPATQYLSFIENIIDLSLCRTKIFWLSFNTRWTAEIGHVIYNKMQTTSDIKYKPCIQTFTFGQHNQNDFCNNHRPIWRISRKDARFYPDNIREKSWRQIHGDKRANPAGRVPGDVFDMPRVTGNSKQRKKWIPTQLNTLLLEKIVKFSTEPDDIILDLCAGSGSMLTVCEKLDRNCHLLEIDRFYCEKIAQEHNMQEIIPGIWT